MAALAPESAIHLAVMVVRPTAAHQAANGLMSLLNQIPNRFRVTAAGTGDELVGFMQRPVVGFAFLGGNAALGVSSVRLSALVFREHAHSAVGGWADRKR